MIVFRQIIRYNAKTILWYLVIDCLWLIKHPYSDKMGPNLFLFLVFFLLALRLIVDLPLLRLQITSWLQFKKNQQARNLNATLMLVTWIIRLLKAILSTYFRWQCFTGIWDLAITFFLCNHSNEKHHALYLQFYSAVRSFKINNWKGFSSVVLRGCSVNYCHHLYYSVRARIQWACLQETVASTSHPFEVIYLRPCLWYGYWPFLLPSIRTSSPKSMPL